MRTTRNGFTLIELLVVISILAVISLVGLSIYNNSQAVARDSKRKQDLKAIAVALEVYFQENSSYPASIGQPGCTFNSGVWCASASPNAWWIPQLNIKYMSSLPKDPSFDDPNPWTGNNGGYAYYANGVGSSCPQTLNHFYALVTTLENTKDPDRNGFHHYTWCANEDTLTNPNFLWSANTYVITSQN